MAITPPAVHHTNQNKKRDFGNPLIQATLLLIVLVLFSWFVLRPKLSQSSEKRNALKAAEQQLSGIKTDKQNLSKLVENLRDSEEEVAKVDEALPLTGRVSKVYVLLDNYVQSSGMTLTLISADDTSKAIASGEKSLLENPYQPGRKLHTVTLSASVTGTMEQFKNLLQLIETSGRVLDVESVEIFGGEAITKFRISVKAYAYEKLDGTL